jgi:hypothetical protein
VLILPQAPLQNNTGLCSGTWRRVINVYPHPDTGKGVISRLKRRCKNSTDLL